MKYQRIISTILIVTGLCLILRSGDTLMVTVHNHSPDEFIYRSEILNAMIAEDQGKMATLKEENLLAKQRIAGILDYCSDSMRWLLAAGIINLYCGCVMLRGKKSPDDATGGNAS